MSPKACPSSLASPAFLAAFAALLSLVAVPHLAAQTGYQVQGSYNPSAMPSAYQQMGVPRAGTGLQQTGGTYNSWQPQATASNYGYNPAYQQFPQPLSQPKPKAPKPLPAPSQPKPQAYYPGQPSGPVPYPASHQLPGANQPAPKPTDGNYAKLANDVAALHYNDNIQDRRLANLERAGQGQVFTTNQPKPTSTPSTNLTYVKHQVRTRETIWGIADRYGVTADDIRRANNRRSDFISDGEILYIPQRVPVQPTGSLLQASPKQPNTTAKTTPAGATHVVQRGESLSAIAAAYRVSLKSLQSANGIRNANLITLGQRLTIPGAVAVSNSAPSTTRKASKPAPQHFVKTAPKAPAKPTQTVVTAPVPPPPGAGTSTGAVIKPTGQRGITSYRVEGGDSIDSVARAFGTTPSEIQRINRLTSAKLPPSGEEIVVPLPGSVAL